MDDRFEKLYLSLLRSEELKKLVPNMKGTWQEDGDMFTYYQKELEQLANLKDVDFE